jgi:hypothetical protein
MPVEVSDHSGGAAGPLISIIVPVFNERTTVRLLAFAAATLACHLPDVVFDAWWYTRFLLPALLPWLALTGALIVAGITLLPD